jgi:Glycosyltransferase like family 2
MSPEPMMNRGNAGQRPQNSPDQGEGTRIHLSSILVACCGQLEYTRLCVPSLLKYTPPPYELHFLDGGSLDGTADYLAGVGAAAPVPVEITRVGSRTSREDGRKDEAVPIRGQNVVLINNDTIVTDGWFTHLVNMANSDSRIGMVAPVSNYAPPPQWIERVPYRLASPELSYVGQVPADTLWAQLAGMLDFARQWREQNKGKWVEADRLGGGCVVLKRPVLQAIGQFPTRTPLGTFDSEGLSHRVRQAGFRLIVCGDVFVHNFGTRHRVNNA